MPPRFVPEDPKAHARQLGEELDRRQEAASEETGAFDPRLLLKLEVEGIAPQDLEAISSGLRLVSQEGKSVVVLFADAVGLSEFRNRLGQVAAGRKPVRQEVLFAIKGIDGWSREDRRGPALRREGVPETASFVVDVELWALERSPDRKKMQAEFGQWCGARQIQVRDQLDQETIILWRVAVTREGLDEILGHRDVRQVDLPPRYQLDLNLLRLELQSIPEIVPPLPEAPGVVILDSGLATNHPLVAPAVGDAQSFVPGLGAEDQHGHGTMVGGIALYGDLETVVASRSFSPTLRLFSGRITDDKNENSSGFVERHIEEAVRYFTSNYGCQVFNLSFGDARKPFLDGHVRGLAAVLDSLARQFGVLFVVSAGNFTGSDEGPSDWKAEYPHYLLSDDACLLDPAPALNVLTVGSLARYEVPRMGQRFPNDPGYQAVARKDEPSPFSRSGPGPRGAIKPEVVEYGGNAYRRTPLKDQEEAIPETGKFRPTARQRSKGTVQAATWELQQVDSRWQDQKLFLVVTRTVPPWAQNLVNGESYALVVVIEDRSQEQVKYYTQLSQRLRVPRVRI